MADLKRIGIGIQTGGLSELLRLGKGGGGGGVTDISAELAKISALFEKARAAGVAGVNRQAEKGRVSAASNLAARGVYRSPASQNTYDSIEAARLGGISDVEGQIAGQEAGTQSQLLQTLLGINVAERNRAAQAKAQRFGALGGVGTNVLLAMLLRNPAMALPALSSGSYGGSGSGGLRDILGGGQSLPAGGGVLRDY